MKTYNFSAGPACLNENVLKIASKATKQYLDTGMSIMEISHRSKLVIELFEQVTERIKILLKIPSNYHILWLQGGASTQFSMVPLNLLPLKSSADYIDTGIWSSKAILECNKIGKANIIATSKKGKYTFIPKQYDQNIDSKYLHITTNNTIYGTQYKVIPEVLNPDGFLVADMSSDILSKQIDISCYGLIYAGAQKNMGPAGVTLVIIRDDLVGKNYRELPNMLDYTTHIDKFSMYNTPPVYAVFVVNETLKWIEDLGGLKEIESLNKKKADRLYSEIRRNKIFESPVSYEDRSLMNVPFIFSQSGLDEEEFILFCKDRNLLALKGHRSVGGFRASIYNSMPEEGVYSLIDAMKEYEQMKS
tara:strand:+ start:572 stop:1654 length:1083 start_codon:yes stop_codon:yes gene_type:complete